jgi:hypothetical protein
MNAVSHAYTVDHDHHPLKIYHVFDNVGNIIGAA